MGTIIGQVPLEYVDDQVDSEGVDDWMLGRDMRTMYLVIEL